MSRKITELGLTLAGAVLFTWLFYKHDPGYNVGIFALFMLFVAYGVKRFRIFGTLNLWLALLFFVSALSYANSGNHFTLFTTWFSGAFWLGSMSLPGINRMTPIPASGFFSVIRSSIHWISLWSKRSSGRSAGKVFRNLVLVGFAVAILLFFSAMYRTANVMFASWLDRIANQLNKLLGDFSFQWFFTFILGLVISITAVLHKGSDNALKRWMNRAVNLVRRRKPLRDRKFVPYTLRFEYKAGILITAMLNVLLLALNFSDIWMVWFGFKWEGQLLKDFVHRGTWSLIVSIFISAGITLYFFRGNLNFLQKNKALKALTYLWLGQNFFLGLSLLVRNLRYIEFYGLAYGRIGIFFFLAATLAMLLFIMLKIRNRETLEYFIHRNVLTSVSILTIGGIADWSPIITRYNLSHYKKSFVHTEYLGQMPDRCLPVLYEYRDRWDEIKKSQVDLGYGYSGYSSGRTVSVDVDFRIREFLRTYPQKGWQERTMSEDRAYRFLKSRVGAGNGEAND